MAAAREMVSNRETYGRTLLDMAEDHPDIVVLGGDLNVSVFTHLWRDQHPDRFFDFGPSEQNLIAVGAGLAASGKIPFVSTFAVSAWDAPSINSGCWWPNLTLTSSSSALTPEF